MPPIGDLDGCQGNPTLSACKASPGDVGPGLGCKLTDAQVDIKGDNLADFLSAVSRSDLDCKNVHFKSACGASESSAGAVKPLVEVPNGTLAEVPKPAPVPAPSLFSFTAVDPNDPVNKLLRRYIHNSSTNGMATLASAQAQSHSSYNGSLEDALDAFAQDALDKAGVNPESRCASGVVDDDVGAKSTEDKKVAIDDENARRYRTSFHESAECNNALRAIFGDRSGSFGSLGSLGSLGEVDFDRNCSFEWLPEEPVTAATVLTNADEIENMLTQHDGIVDGFDGNLICDDLAKCDFKVTLHGDVGQTDVDLKLQELSLVHESLNAGSEVASLCHLEKFLLELLQPSITATDDVNFPNGTSLGNLTRFGRLLAFVNLNFVQKHIAQLTALYRHPEMTAFRSAMMDKEPVLAPSLDPASLGYNGAAGNIWNTIQYSAGYEDPFPDGTNTQAIVKLLNKLSKSESNYGTDSVSYNNYSSAAGSIGDADDGIGLSLIQATTSSAAYGCSLGSCSSNFKTGCSSSSLGGGDKNGPHTTSAKLQRQLVEILDCLSCAYTTGREPHFPRFVCGVVDRAVVNATETFSVPLKKGDRRNVHVQMERLSNTQREWPQVNVLPPILCEGMEVQIAPQKMHSYMYWREGTITSINAGVITVSSATEQDRERTFSFKNFMAPNCPVIKLERGYWRLMPRKLCLETDLYVGSCLCIDDGSGDYVDGVIVNLYFERNCIAPVKSPGDESLFEHVNACGASLEANVTCTCTGHCLRVFEGRTLPRQPVEVVFHHFHENRQRIYSVENLEGYKLNYDLQAHYDLAKQGNSTYANLSFCVWVVPRDLSLFKGINLSSGWNFGTSKGVVMDNSNNNSNGNPVNANGISITANVDATVKKWMFDTRRVLILFPYNRNIDIFQDTNCQILSFLHPEVNFVALAAGVWSVRSGDKVMNIDAAYLSSLAYAATTSGVGESNSCTRSQKAAIRDSTLETTDQTSGIVNCRFPLLRRLYGCHPIISIWIAVEAIDPNAHRLKPDLNVQVPALPPCTRCKGTVYSRREITRCVPYHQGGSHSVYIFSNLERTSDLVRRLQHVAACRWRVTRDFLASYRVDDDIASYFRAGPGYSTDVQPPCNEQLEEEGAEDHDHQQHDNAYGLDSGNDATADGNAPNASVGGATGVAGKNHVDVDADALQQDEDTEDVSEGDNSSAARRRQRSVHEDSDSQHSQQAQHMQRQASDRVPAINFGIEFGGSGCNAANDLAVAAAASVGGVNVTYIPDGHNYSFLRHLYHVMANVRATIDTAPLDDFYYRNAYLDIRHDLASATEVAMEQGWEAYIRPLHASNYGNSSASLPPNTRGSSSSMTDVSKLIKSPLKPPQEFKTTTFPSIPGMEAFSDFSQLMRLKGQDLTKALPKDFDASKLLASLDTSTDGSATRLVGGKAALSSMILPMQNPKFANADVAAPAGANASGSVNTSAGAVTGTVTGTSATVAGTGTSGYVGSGAGTGASILGANLVGNAPAKKGETTKTATLTTSTSSVVAAATDFEQLAAFNRAHESKQKPLSLEVPPQYMQMLNANPMDPDAAAAAVASLGNDVKAKGRLRIPSKRVLKDAPERIPRKVRNAKVEEDSDFSNFEDKESRLLYLSCVDWDEHLENQSEDSRQPLSSSLPPPNQ